MRLKFHEMHPFRFAKLIKLCKSYPIISHKYQKLPSTYDSLRYCHGNSSPGGDDNVHNFSLFSTKKALKASGLNFDDGFTSIKTECPVCDQCDTKKESIFINKTTGQFICPRCQHSCEWKTAEKFFTGKSSLTLEKQRKLFVDGKRVMDVDYLNGDMKAMKDVDEDETTKILNNLGIKVSLDCAKLKSRLNFINVKKSILEYPLKCFPKC